LAKRGQRKEKEKAKGDIVKGAGKGVREPRFFEEQILVFSRE
jgi:hypothetical protein